MAVSLEEALRLRFENSCKWEDYFNSGGKMTPEVVEQMKADNKRIGEIYRFAWLEAHKSDKDRG